MDAIDRKLLELLQADATLPIAELAQRVNLSQTPCWKRVQRLKETGAIRAQVALCDPRKLGVGTTVFVAIRTNQHTEEWAQRFTQAVSERQQHLARPIGDLAAAMEMRQQAVARAEV